MLQHWAEGQPLVRRVWLFGSRVRGEYRPDSDLDVAVELDLDVAVDECRGMTHWIEHAASWERHLAHLLRVPVDLELHEPGGQVEAYVADCSRLVYVKAGGRLE